MAIPGNGTTLPSANIYQLTAPGAPANAGATANGIVSGLGLGSTAFIANPLATGANTSFSVTNGVESISFTNPSTNVTTTISGVTEGTAAGGVQEGSTGFTFTAANGGTYYLSTVPIGGTAALDVNTNILFNNPLTGGVAGTLDSLVGPNPTVYVGATNTPNDLSGGAFIACFLRGTHIETVNGERLVEDLAIGDSVLTVSGAFKPILWIGRRSYAAAFADGGARIIPVRIARGALADSRPRRDLRVSPCHALLIDGVLVPAREIVNGKTIAQEAVSGPIDYFHIEMEEHDIIVAEGVLAETYIDDSNRAMFQNAAEYDALYPDREDVEPIYAAPRVEDGEILQAVRDRLADRAEAGSTSNRRAA